MSVSGLFDSWNRLSQDQNPLRKWFWMIFLMARQKSGISMVSAQRMLKIKNYKAVRAIGHKIHRDAAYSLAGLIEMDDTQFGL
jgi:hypothetical protein